MIKIVNSMVTFKGLDKIKLDVIYLFSIQSRSTAWRFEYSSGFNSSHSLNSSYIHETNFLYNEMKNIKSIVLILI